MLRLCLCMLAGAYALSLCRELPSDTGLVAAIATTGVCFCIRAVRPVACMLLGLVMMWIASRNVLNDRLSPELQGQTLAATVKVASFPEMLQGSVRFAAETMEEPALPGRIRLSWYDAPEMPQLGQTWRLKVRLRRPRGFANDTGFDYELWLARQQIGATGYVLASPSNTRVDSVPVDGRSRMRARLVDRITKVAGENDATAVLLAISVGAVHLISNEQWERYAISGTSHLMAISGLHIGLAAGGAWLLCRLMMPVFCRSANIRDLAAWAAVVAACAYAEISGFAIPARRAMLMALLVMLAFVLRRQLSPVRVISASCVLILATDPLAIHAAGFKLSFGAVALLLWRARQHCPVRGGGPALARRLAVGLRRLLALQLVLLFGLLPMSALIFGRMSWMAPAVNLVVMPLFNLVTVPAVLLGLLFDGPAVHVGDALLKGAWHSVNLMLSLIRIVADWPPARIHIATATGIMTGIVVLAALWSVLPPGFPGRKVAWVAAAAALMYRAPPPPQGCIDMHALEVGQGLSAVLRTAQHTLVFDTGPSFRSGSDVGQLVLVPWLRSAGEGTVDMLVVSHAHDDHSGGAATLIDAVEVMQILAGEEVASIARPQLKCRSGQTWLWDGVRFSVMHPGLYPLQSGNNSSCVLEIAAGVHKILLAGDIEAPVEKHLVRIGALSPVDIVLVPHHGSRTSSSPAFVSALRPSVAIVSAGFDNRWGFPKEDVVERWQQAGARVMNTATSGAIHYRVCANTGVHLHSEQRVRMRRYWHEPAAP